jgi:hypothetical protein
MKNVRYLEIRSLESIKGGMTLFFTLVMKQCW